MEIHKRGKQAGEPPESTRYVEITGYKYPYRIGDFGNVQRQWADGSWHDIQPWKTQHRGAFHVSFTTLDGKRELQRVTDLMDRYFFDGYAKKHGLYITHKNEMKYDCSYWNLKFITPRQLQEKNPGKSHRVALLSASGELLEVYESAKEAAKANFVSEKVVYNRVKHKVKNPCDFMGKTFVFVEELDRRVGHAKETKKKDA